MIRFGPEGPNHQTLTGTLADVTADYNNFICNILPCSAYPIPYRVLTTSYLTHPDT